MEDAGGRKRAWPQCRWAAAGPGRASRRHAQPHVSRPGIAGVEDAGGTGGYGCGAVGGGRACPGIKMTLGADQYARPHWCEGRRRGLAGLRGDAPSEARGADGSRAGRHPPAHTAARPHNPAQQAPRTPAAPINTTTGTARTRPGIQKTDIRIGCRSAVELGGFEPPTFSLRTRRATNCAIAPRTHTA